MRITASRAAACRVALSATSRTLGTDGGSITVNVEGADRCSWRAWSTDDFLSVSEASGTGGDELVVRVASNAGGARTGYVIVAGETLTIHQSGAGAVASVCERTPAVARKLTELANRSRCQDVTEHDLLAVGVLNLEEQGITALTSRDFDGLWNLVELNLTNNQIRDLPEGVFDDLTSLKRLVLWDNPLGQLPATTFDALSGLTGLGLSRNGLTRIEEGTFDALTNLRDLGISNQSLTELPDDLFVNLTELSALWLSGNRFQEIPGAIQSLDNLTFLDLSVNPLKRLPANAFAGSPKLYQLFVARTGTLSSISEDAFAGFTQLGHLHLDHNKIEDLSGVVIPGGRISLLDLSNNALSSLPPDLFRGFTSEACNGQNTPLTLRLNGNPGFPFSLAVELVRLDADNAADSPSRVVARVLEGAPWPLTVDLAVDGGSLSTAQVVIPNGSVQSEPFEVTANRTDQPVTIRPVRATELPPAYRGLKVVLGAPLRLFLQPAATPDFNSDGSVDITDFLQFVEHFGLSQGNAGYDARFDLDGDNNIGIGDFLIFVQNFGKKESST